MERHCHPGRGYLELILGCMFSGKTSALIEVYKQYQLCDSTCLVVNYSGDQRYSQTHLATHDNKLIPCVFTENLMDLLGKRGNSNPTNNDVVLINEGQFFSDLVPFVTELVDHHSKKVYVCGLDGDFKREKFGTILDLVPKADSYRKLRAVCIKCKDGTPASFTHRLSPGRDQTLIGSNEYIPVCRGCYSSAVATQPAF